MSNKDLQVLMLEEDNDDRYITEDLMQQLGFTQPPTFFSNSEDLFRFLSVSTKPSLILIDYNLSIENGLEVLKKIKVDPNFKKFPVIILSDSALPKYVQECYAYGASSYIKKPNNVSETRKKIEIFFQYWFEVAEL